MEALMMSLVGSLAQDARAGEASAVERERAAAGDEDKLEGSSESFDSDGDEGEDEGDLYSDGAPYLPCVPPHLCASLGSSSEDDDEPFEIEQTRFAVWQQMPVLAVTQEVLELVFGPPRRVFAAAVLTDFSRAALKTLGGRPPPALLSGVLFALRAHWPPVQWWQR
jgi:hypothetical protein